MTETRLSDSPGQHAPSTYEQPVARTGERTGNGASPSLPSGPGAPALFQTLAWMRNPTTVLSRCAERFGTPFTLKRVASQPMVVVSHPADVRSVFTGSSEMRLERSDTSTEILGSSLPTLDGDEHRRRRHLIMPAFKGAREPEHARLIRDITLRHIDRWGDRVGLMDALFEITGETIFRLLFGVERAHELEELSKSMDVMFAEVSSPAIYLPLARIRLGRVNAWSRYLAARDVFHRQLAQEIERAREQPDRNDILARTVAQAELGGDPLTDHQVRDEMMSLLLLGHATTSTALASAFQWVLGTPGVRERLTAEIRDGAANGSTAAESSWVEAAILESLRISPPLAITQRFLSDTTEIGGYALPRDTFVRPSPFLTHRRADVYEEPERYEPHRFMDARPSPFEFYPFGGGLRTCIGMTFALFQMKVIVATVIERLDLELETEATTELRRVGLLMAPAHGTPVRIVRRLSSERRTAVI